ncbi:hypothetical protein D1646_06230 [Pseudoflavonifractor sp. 60]|uniref:DNA/RNA non-specific endonuclease n=1 Tax=Pseudoflavonifractor sp. 60 TaxID=2304576 RepID=UPI00136A3F7C|nr:DNA/RNA non-specific endonuclease [Pseudoflavonifractor sp. 60]NBI66415.1 hypothetical protein [Pseudoflavonifractor sp. 60]
MAPKRYLSLFLAILLCMQCLTGCSNSGSDVDPGTFIEEDKIYQDVIAGDFISEDKIQAKYIAENLIFENGIYEVTIGEQFICQSYIFEITITPDSKTDILQYLPEDIVDYDIDWPKVISQFAVGTSVVIAVGAINTATGGKTFFVFGSAAGIAAEAIISGAIEATMKVILTCDEGDAPKAKVAKYAIEGFSEGYMWGAIAGAVENIVTPTALRSKGLGKLVVDNFGNVKDKTGKIIGKALYSTAEKQITLIDDAGRILGFFKSNGDEILDVTKVALKANSAFWRGSGDDAVRCLTDAAGKIYRIGDDLVPNSIYKINGYMYQTDDLGRIISVSFEKLTMKPVGQARKTLGVSIDDIGRGFQQIGDQRGHIIGDRFNGTGGIENLVPMSSKLNQSEYLAVENLWAESLKDGKAVQGTIQLLYDGSSFRPSRMDVSYIIDGVSDFVKLFN